MRFNVNFAVFSARAGFFRPEPEGGAGFFRPEQVENESGSETLRPSNGLLHKDYGRHNILLQAINTLILHRISPKNLFYVLMSVMLIPVLRIRSIFLDPDPSKPTGSGSSPNPWIRIRIGILAKNDPIFWTKILELKLLHILLRNIFYLFKSCNCWCYFL